MREYLLHFPFLLSFFISEFYSIFLISKQSTFNYKLLNMMARVEKVLYFGDSFFLSFFPLFPLSLYLLFLFHSFISNFSLSQTIIHICLLSIRARVDKVLTSLLPLCFSPLALSLSITLPRFQTLPLFLLQYCFSVYCSHSICLSFFREK